MDLEKVRIWKQEMTQHLENELLPFWKNRCWDGSYGGYLTQFDKEGGERFRAG